MRWSRNTPASRESLQRKILSVFSGGGFHLTLVILRKCDDWFVYFSRRLCVLLNDKFLKLTSIDNCFSMVIIWLFAFRVKTSEFHSSKITPEVLILIALSVDLVLLLQPVLVRTSLCAAFLLEQIR